MYTKHRELLRNQTRLVPVTVVCCNCKTVMHAADARKLVAALHDVPIDLVSLVFTSDSVSDAIVQASDWKRDLFLCAACRNTATRSSAVCLSRFGRLFESLSATVSLSLNRPEHRVLLTLRMILHEVLRPTSGVTFNSVESMWNIAGQSLYSATSLPRHDYDSNIGQRFLSYL